GTETCNAGEWQGCPLPQEEACNNQDDNCDGIIDNITQSTNEQGLCFINTETCIEGTWTPNNEYTPQEETCNNLDDDCDGTTDNMTQDCSVQHLGVCALGTELCTEGTWDGCPLPQTEICDLESQDEDCDGQINEENSTDCTTYYHDEDSDTWGLELDNRCLCAPLDPYDSTQFEDCNDTNPDVNLDATEACNGIDDDCDGNIDEENATGCSIYYYDEDSDTWGLQEDNRCLCGPEAEYSSTQYQDCDDTNPGINPGMPEIYYNFLDDDCNASTIDWDKDSDGYPAPPFGTDCNDNDPNINPGMPEIPGNGIDDDCNASTGDYDVDGDGYEGCYPYYCGDDCDDNNASINPGAAEICDNVDNDCDGVIDNITQSTNELGECIINTETCIAGNWTPNNEYSITDEICNNLDDDCDGTIDMITQDCSVQHLGICALGTELCTEGSWDGCPIPEEELCNDDGLDEDCDGNINEPEICSCLNGQTQPCPFQYGVCVGAFETCTEGQWPGCTADNYGPDYEAGTELTCDGLDNDCDVAIDENITNQTGSTDVGECSFGLDVCIAGNWTVNITPIYPENEICDGLDNDCNNLTDDDLVPELCLLQDGVCAGSTKVCGGELGWLDCTADNYGPDYEAGTETSCDSLDNDCDGTVDMMIQECSLNYQGICAEGNETCTLGLWFGCPAPQTEICDGTLDEDCDGTIDEPNATNCLEYYYDGDSDTWGLGLDNRCLCAPEDPYDSTQFEDCDDANPEVNPDATETCNGIDDDCDTLVDEENATGCLVYYYDGDNDTWGLELDNKCLCTPQDQYTSNQTQDCDDTDASINPEATEICDGVDNDCDFMTDNITQPCSLQDGVCTGAFETCTDGSWPGCTDADYGLDYEPGTEVSCDNLDNDCDSQTDEDLYQDVACGQDECNGLVTQQCLDSDYQDIGNCSSYSNPCRVDDNYSIYGCYAGTDFDDDTYKEDHYFLCNEIGICTDYAHDWQLDEECNTTQYCWYSVDDGSDNYYCQDNKCPDFTSVPLTQAIVYTPYDYTAVADDPEDSVLTYSLDLIPVGTSMMSIDPATGVIDWTPSPDQINSYNLAADNSVTVRVDDGMCSVTQEFEITVHGICSEDDGGIKYFTKGRVNGTGCYAGDCMDYDTSDWCNGPDVLIEFYCSNGDLKSTEKNCINGCEDGACNIEPYCDDTDGGSDYFEFGIVSYDGIDYEDVCNGSTLTEYYCSNDMMNYDFYVCENGCSDGACQLMKAQDLQKNRIR
ncbi:putative metal-binding motif-containing protein, partial [Candidatus Woesearchaeota archaeon]|nr:putative metal-binding motif-containing protein [Candidatus Woesearchaeota archaeon]